MPKPILPIAKLGNPVLREKAKELSPKQVESKEIKHLIKKMKSVLKQTGDLGLAGNQAYQPIRVITLQVPKQLIGNRLTGVPLQALINPKIVHCSDKIIEDWEGCLSFNYLRGRVPRQKQVIIEALNEQGEPITIEAYDLHARVLQHEIDHLDGILYLDRMTDMKSLMSLEEFMEKFREETTIIS